MTLPKLFFDGSAPDPIYSRVRDHKRSAREHCESLWARFESLADEDFRTDIRTHFHARYWEMYLTVTLIELGFDVCCPKPGPDIGLLIDGQRIWIEATTSERGSSQNLDQVALEQANTAQYVPNEKMILRYLSGISRKVNEQYPKWVQSNVVAKDECFIVALNPRQIGFEYGDTNPPRILQTAFKLGSPYVTVSCDTGETIKSGYQHRPHISRANGTNIETGVFQIEEYRVLSGLLCSRIDLFNQALRFGSDFQLVPNPNASAPLPNRFRLPGTYYDVSAEGAEFCITPRPYFEGPAAPIVRWDD